MRSICRGAEPRRLIRNSAGDMNFSSAKKKRPSSRNRLRCSAAERTRRPASKPTARVSDHFVSNTVRPDDVIVNVTSRLSTVGPRPVRLKISGTLSPVRSRSTIPSRTMVSLRTGVEARTVASSIALRCPFSRSTDSNSRVSGQDDEEVWLLKGNWEPERLGVELPGAAEVSGAKRDMVYTGCLDLDSHGWIPLMVRVRDEGTLSSNDSLAPPNGSRLSCGRKARWRKVGEQMERYAGEGTQFFFTCERPAA